MLGAVKRWFGGRADACAGCDPAVLEQCAAAEPGSVTPHNAHVFLKLAAPPSSDPAATDESWWPESVDKEPAIEAVNAAIKAAGERVGGKVKVTAFDSLVPAQVAPGTADALVFPAGVSLTGLPLDQLPAAVVAALAGEAVPRGEQVAGLTLFVCCHAKRDERCGHIGPALAAKLAELATGKQAPGGGAVRVLKTSHVGGHKYAGNVLVYNKGQSTDGDWFGGLNAQNAGPFLEALLASRAPSGAAGEAALRPWWRGRVGLSKAEQLQHFEQGLKDIEDLR